MKSGVRSGSGAVDGESTGKRPRCRSKRSVVNTAFFSEGRRTSSSCTSTSPSWDVARSEPRISNSSGSRSACQLGRRCLSGARFDLPSSVISLRTTNPRKLDCSFCAALFICSSLAADAEARSFVSSAVSAASAFPVTFAPARLLGSRRSSQLPIMSSASKRSQSQTLSVSGGAYCCSGSHSCARIV